MFMGKPLILKLQQVHEKRSFIDFSRHQLKSLTIYHLDYKAIQPKQIKKRKKRKAKAVVVTGFIQLLQSVKVLKKDNFKEIHDLGTLLTIECADG